MICTIVAIDSDRNGLRHLLNDCATITYGFFRGWDEYKPKLSSSRTLAKLGRDCTMVINLSFDGLPTHRFDSTDGESVFLV